jgi:hypothetical protein
VRVVKTPSKAPPIQSYMIKQNKMLSAETFLKKNMRSTFSHVYRPQTTTPDLAFTPQMKERVVTHHGSSTHSDAQQKSYISTVVVTNPDKTAVKK